VNLTKTTLQPDLVAKLAKFNIRKVGQLLSMGQQPVGLMSLAEVLELRLDQVRALLDKLRKEHPKAEPPPGPERTLPFGLIETRKTPK
jgi:hypothetical protein